jgi:hypothetical protein
MPDRPRVPLASGHNLTLASDLGFPRILARPGLADAQTQHSRRLRHRPPSPGGHRDRPEQPTKACLADANRPADSRGPRHDGTHPPHWHEQDLGLAVAGTVPDRRRARPAARQDPAAPHSTTWNRGRGPRGRRHPNRRAGRGYTWTSVAMTKQTGISFRHLAQAWLAATPGTSVQTVQRSEVCRQLLDIVGLYVAPPAHAVVLSIDEKSQIQRLTGSNRACP